MKLSMMMVSVVLAMVIGCADEELEPRVAAGASSGAGDAVACDDAACAAGCYVTCGETRACVAVEGEPPGCDCACE
jgi:hypothetical protein